MFTPTLLALSFVFADWRTGLVVLAVAVGAWDRGVIPDRQAQGC